MTNNKITKSNNSKSKKKIEKKEKLNKNTKIMDEKNLYFSFNERIVINLILVIVIVILLTISFFMSFSITKPQIINYKDKSNIDYKVYLKKNDFYETEYLNKGMAYVASLIDKINIKYNYNFNVNEDSDIDLKYKVMAKLVISSQNNSKIFYENEYEIAKEEIAEIRNEKEYLLNKEVIIDYDYYNNLVNKFKSRYAVNTTSYLEVYLLVNEESKDTNEYYLNNQTRSILRIPLSEQEINIGLEETNVSDSKQIISDAKFILGNIKFLIIDVILLILFIISLIKLFKKISVVFSKKSNYDKYVNRLLRGYDRLIVNVRTAPNLEDYNIVKVDSFEELIDMRDNVKEPIRYFVITEHQKCEFFIINHNELYLYVVKSVDLDNPKNNAEKKY